MSEQEDENEEENQEEEGDEDEQGEGDDDQDQDEEDEQEGSQQGEDGSGDDEDQQSGEGDSDQQGNSEGESKPGQQQKKDFVPKFRSLEPQEFKLTNLLSQISSLSMNVDHFITTLPSRGGPTYRSYLPPAPKYVPPAAPLVVVEQPRVLVMKDEDVQVSMQPQIVIQPTRIEKPPVEPAYKISSESNKFLAQLYEENKKLKRWQNSSHNMNSNNGGSSANGFYGSKERFERQDYEKGLFNVEERNREIDEAIEKLRSEDREG